MMPNADELKMLNKAIRKIFGKGVKWREDSFFAIVAGNEYAGSMNGNTANEAMWMMKAISAALAVDHPQVKRYGMERKKSIVFDAVECWNMATSCIAYGDNTIALLTGDKYMAAKDNMSGKAIRALCEVALSAVANVNVGVFTDAESGSYNSITLKDFNAEGGAK